MGRDTAHDLDELTAEEAALLPALLDEMEAAGGDFHEYNLRGVTAFAVLAQLQLAFKHPTNARPNEMAMLALRFARALEVQIRDLGPTAALVAAKGWEGMAVIGPLPDPPERVPFAVAPSMGDRLVQ